jgi:peptidoglycan hydrolase-like protein with peptidoglycan-binding domain
LHLRKAVAIIAAGLIGSTAWPAADTTTADRAKKKPTSSSASKKSAYRKPVARAAARPRGQAVPTPDRYKEIQDALAKKGYLHADPTGVWDQNSADALRRFQQDQNLQASGKLDSLSIIALGLGPKH